MGYAQQPARIGLAATCRGTLKSLDPADWIHRGPGWSPVVLSTQARRPEPEEVAALVRSAADGDRAAWTALVDLYSGLIWNVARGHRLAPGDAADISQTTWLRLLEHLDRLDDPARVGAWLATTARRECLRILGLAGRQTLVGDERFLDAQWVDDTELDAAMIAAEQRERLQAGLDRLPERCGRLLRVLMEQDVPNYERVAALLEMPVGSIGPTRARCLAKLRVILAEIDVEASADPAARTGGVLAK